MTKSLFRGVTVATLILGFAGAAAAQTVTLRASHQFPGGKGDARDEMVQIIAREVKAAGVGLRSRSIRAPRCSSRTSSGTPWSTASSISPPSRSTMPAAPSAVQRHADAGPGAQPRHAQKLNDSPFMADIKKIIDDAGVIVLATPGSRAPSPPRTASTPADMKGR
jgi:TRAP-type transport system periplasmic protein